jgi:hypothetical protein
MSIVALGWKTLRYRRVLAAVLTAAPLAAQTQWSIDDLFTSRRDSAAVYDVARAATIVFGGFDGMDRNDTWRWDGTSLTRLSPATSPPPMRGHVMVYDAVRERIVVFGRPAGVHQTWAFDGLTWSQIATSTVPTTNGQIAMAYDVARDRAVLVDAPPASSYVRLWEFDGSNWMQIPIAPPTWPGSPQSLQFTYDATAGNCAFWRGESSPGMWRWNGATWSYQPSTSTLTQFGAQMVHDPVQQRLLLVGGSYHPSTTPRTHRWSPGAATWQPLANDGPEAQFSAVAFDPVRNRLVYLGGASTQVLSTTLFDSSLWEWNGVQWTKRLQGPPCSREETALAVDRGTGRLVMYGGVHTTDLGDTWQFHQGQWQLLIGQSQFAGPTHPGNARGGRLLFDEARQEFLLFTPNSSAPSRLWRLAGNQWLSTGIGGPSARTGAAVCYDRLRQRTLLFGGRVGVDAQDDFWQWNGTAWTQLQPALVPQARHEAGMAYDPLRDRVVLVGGQLLGGAPGDTWEFDGTNWQQFAGGAGPAGPRPQVCWDEARQAIVAFDTGQTSAATARTWQWDGASWQEIAVGTTPGRLKVALASLPDRLLLIGGAPGLSGGYFALPANLTSPALANLTTFGPSGASSAGPLLLTGTGARPWIGSNIALRIAPLPQWALPGAWLGASSSEWQGTALPISLQPLGFAGSMLVAPDVPLPVLDLGTGEGRLAFTVPSAPSLIGAAAFCQTFVFEPFTGAVATSNGVQLVLGSR